jgi:hypothetical protein
MRDFRSLIAKVGQKVQLTADIYPLPAGGFRYKWEITRGKNIASVDQNGVLTVSRNAIPGDQFTVKTTAITKDPFIRPKPSIVTYLVQ